MVRKNDDDRVSTSTGEETLKLVRQRVRRQEGGDTADRQRV